MVMDHGGYMVNVNVAPTMPLQAVKRDAAEGSVSV